MRKLSWPLAALSVLLCGSAGSTAAPPAPAARKASAAPASASRKIPIQEVKLKNGLRVLLSEDHSAPTYSIAVTYNVGSRNERQGRTGFAHLFEHMMFQGSENVGKGEHFILIQNYGGNLNGTTDEDRTNYFQTLPANQLDLGLFLESDRMRSLVINQANLDNQRNAVQEERRLGVDNQAYGKTFEAISDTAYDNFAYKHSVIGSMADLNAANVQDVADFFRVYYAPNNAVLALVGDFQPADALARIRKYFEPIPSQPAPPPVDSTEPAQTAERRKTMEDAFAQAPRLDIVFKIPAGNTPDWYALSVMGQILGAGDSSRLYQKLIKEQELAVNVGGGAQQKRGPSLQSVGAVIRPGKDVAAVEKVIYEEIERLKNEPVADWEMEKVRMQTRRQRAQQFQGTLARAVTLGHDTVFYNEPSLINTEEEKRKRVTKEDVQRVARTYLTPANRTVIVTTPKPKAPAASSPSAE
jgi:zinc protease